MLRLCLAATQRSYGVRMVRGKSFHTSYVNMKFIDIGANLTDLMYQGEYHGSKKHDPDLSSVLERAWKQDLQKMIITGTNLEDSKKAIEMSKSDERLFSTVGCHPTRCLEFESHKNGAAEGYMSELEALVNGNRDQVVAFGEFGLDYDRLNFCDKDTQKKYFEYQLKAASKLELPLFLHCRNAASDLVDCLRKYADQLRGGVVHSFDGSIEEAKEILALGYHIGINGCSLKTEENLSVVREIPCDKLMLETDCPWCEIRPSHAGYKLVQTKLQQYPSVKKDKWKEGAMVKSRNEPASIVQVLEVVAAVKEEDPNDLADLIYHNTNKLFFEK